MVQAAERPCTRLHVRWFWTLWCAAKMHEGDQYLGEYVAFVEANDPDFKVYPEELLRAQSDARGMEPHERAGMYTVAALMSSFAISKGWAPTDGL